MWRNETFTSWICCQQIWSYYLMPSCQYGPKCLLQQGVPNEVYVKYSYWVGPDSQQFQCYLLHSLSVVERLYSRYITQESDKLGVNCFLCLATDINNADIFLLCFLLSMIFIALFFSLNVCFRSKERKLLLGRTTWPVRELLRNIISATPKWVTHFQFIFVSHLY